MQIRKVTIQDINTIYAFERAYILEFEPDHIKRWDDAKIKTIEGLENHINQMFLAEVNQKIVGHCYWGLLNKMPCIYSIYVKDAFRGQGIAKALMLQTEEHASKDYPLMTLSTLEHNPAQHLFLKLGYKRLDVKEGWIQFEKSLNMKKNS